MSRLERGFTMVEVLVALTVTTAILLVISNFMMSSLQTSTKETATANIQHEIQLTLDSVADDVRLSANADLHNRNPDTYSPGGTSNEYGWSSNATTLVLATAATNASNTILFEDPANYVTTKDNIIYFVSNGTLYKRTLAANVSGNRVRTTCPAANVTATCQADKALLKNVTAFNVTYLDGNNQSVSATDARAIELKVTASRVLYKQTQSASYTTRMVFRND
jgi:prepilin-type N-terminal cleavage/methylation domain-containing protein